MPGIYLNKTLPRKQSKLVFALGAAGFISASSIMGFLIGHRLSNPSVVAAGVSSGVGRLVGKASVVDGDTIEIQGTRIRLNGIDAPEVNQPCQEGSSIVRCGVRAARFLDERLRTSTVRCDFVEWDKYGRFVGNCQTNEGVDVAAMLVSNGHALDWPHYSGGRYRAEQLAAKALGKGIWAGSFEEPWAYREKPASEPVRLVAVPETSETPVRSQNSPSGTGCKIKGNISQGTGEKIYHVPGQQHYSRTKVSMNQGERWFCSEAEARSAGWRASKR